MDRNREVRKTTMAASNGLSRRRQQQQRTSSLRDSPEEDGPMEMQETTRLRDRASKKDRERLSRSKRRRADRLMHASNREDGGEDSTEESLDDVDDDDEDDEPGPIRMPPPNPSSSASLSNHLHHRKSFPPVVTKAVRAAPWKVTDEMGFSVPKKARSASAKRSHECWSGGGTSGGGGGSTIGGGGEQIHRQASTSPARPVSLPAPASPSSSSASLKKKIKPIGHHKQRPPKVAKPSPAQDEIEFEVAEVLFGLKQSSKQESSSQSQRLDSKEVNGSSNDCRSRVSSPISVSQSYQSQKLTHQNSTSTSLSAVAPKRKRPRPVKYEEESSTSFSVRNGRIETEQQHVAKVETTSPKLEKNTESPLENNGGTGTGLNSGNLQAPPVLSEPPNELGKPESNLVVDSKKLTVESNDRDGVQSKEVVSSPQKESPSSGKDFEVAEDTTTTKASSTASGVENHRVENRVENHREDNFKIDLMAPPSKSSPERDGVIGFGLESNSIASVVIASVEMTQKVDNEVKEQVNVDKMRKAEAGLVEKKIEAVVEECESQKSIATKPMNIDLQIDLEKSNKDDDPSTSNANKSQQLEKQQQQHQQQHQQQQHHHQQQQSIAPKQEPKLEKDAQSTPTLLSMTPAGWPGGLPSLGCGMGQVRPPQGVVSMDGNSGPSNAIQPPHLFPSQPRPKRCTTHYYIARNIYLHQQFAKMNPYWPAAAGSASLYGAKPPYNLNVMPPVENAIIGNPIQGILPGRNPNSTQDKGQVEVVKDKSSVASSFMDPTQKKQIVLQQATQPMHGPAYIFHLSQQQAAAVASSKPAAVMSQTSGNPSSSSAHAAPGSSSSTAAAAATLNFNYQNLPGNDGQYLAILQNNGYPFPVPTHVGAPGHYRGGATPAQAMPFFNGPFYSSQMVHPSQLQQQQQLQAQSQQQQGQQVHQNTSTSSGSSSSQKHQQSQQHRLQGGGNNAPGGNSNNFPISKNKPQQQQNHSVPVTHQVRPHETDMVVEDSPSTEDSRVSQSHKTLYSHNYGMAIHPKSFASMSSAAIVGGSSGNVNDKPQQSSQQQNPKGGAELVPAQAFAMPFASFNGGSAVPGFDMAQNHVIFQSLPEAARHGYQQMAAAVAAAQAAHQKRNHQFSEEMKMARDSNITDDERKAMAGKGSSSVGQAIVFSRPDSTDPSTILGSSVVDSSARTLNLISAPGNVNRNSRSSSSASAAGVGPGPGASSTVNTSNSQQQQQQHQMMQFHKHQQQQQQLHQQQQQQQQQMQQQQQQQMQQQLHHQLAAAAVARSKPTNTTNTSVYSDRLSSSMTNKFPNAVSVFPQALIQGGSPAQSPQWKSSNRPAGASASSPSLSSSSSSLKNHHPQQQGRTQQGHTQISFGVNNPKGGSASHGQQIPTSNQSSSPPVVVGSPPRSMSKSAGGSPRTTSTGSKVGPATSLASQQQAKSSSSGPSRKSSPVGGRNVPSILGNSHVTSASPSTKPQSQHQHQQQQQKQTLQQTQLFFSNAYAQAQAQAQAQAHSPQSTSTINPTGASAIGYYHQRRQSEQQQQQQGSSNTSSAMLSLCPLTLAGVTTSDPTKAVAAAAAAAAANNMKGGIPPQGLLQAAQFANQSGGHPFMSFPYMHSVSAVQTKPAEQKQSVGNDNLHGWQPEKR